jgi:DNA-directed RNA polymerase specialized sigma24 family protein
MPAATPAMTPAQQLNAQFTTLYAQHRQRLTALVRREVRLGDIDIADDLTADAFYRAWLDLHKCEATTDSEQFAWLATIARRIVGHHYRAKKNTAEIPADIGHWTYSNRAMDHGPGGTYTPAATGFRTARIANSGDSDPDMNEALRRVRAGGSR